MSESGKGGGFIFVDKEQKLELDKEDRGTGFEITAKSIQYFSGGN